jgi:hypothetical protein
VVQGGEVEGGLGVAGVEVEGRLVVARRVGHGAHVLVGQGQEVVDRGVLRVAGWEAQAGAWWRSGTA